MEARYLTTKDAAAYLGVCTQTFGRMIAALPVSRRPAQVVFPGVSVKRWRKDDLDAAFSKASAASQWDIAIEGGRHGEDRNKRRRGSSRAGNGKTQDLGCNHGH